MKKCAILLLLFIYVFSSTEFSELLKIDEFIEHYSEHKEASQQITFSEFLYMHYVDHGKDSGEGKNEGDLPFQSNTHNELVNFITPIVIPTTNFIVAYIQTVENNEPKEYYDVCSIMKSSFLASIWQPPQIV